MKAKDTFKYIKITIGLLLLILGTFLLFLPFFPTKISKYNKPENDLLTITSYLINDPIYYQKSRKHALRLELHGSSGIYFDNENEFLEATDYISFLKDAKYHDTVSIKVLKADYEKYYVNRESRSVAGQLFDAGDKLSFYSLRFHNKEYMGSIYEAAEKRRKEGLIADLFIGLAVVGAGIYFILAKK